MFGHCVIRTNHKKILSALLVLVLLALMTACGKKDVQTPEKTSGIDSKTSASAEQTDEITKQNTTQQSVKTTSVRTANADNVQEESEKMLQMKINGTAVFVEWEDNNAVRELKNMCKEKPITVDTSMYGGFEQVGSISKTLPREDKQITTSAGDIVLYSGNQLVVFFGSNTWAYTKLGHINDKSETELAELLSSENVQITLEMADM